MSAATKSRVVRRIVSITIGLLVLVGAAVVWGWWKSEQEWDRLALRLTALETELRAGDGARRVLWGEKTAGNAWDDYENALEMMGELLPGHFDGEEIESEFDPVLDRISEGFLIPGPVTAVERRLVARVEPAIARMRQGAHRGRHRRPFERRLRAKPLAYFAEMGCLDRIAGLQIRDLLQAGRSEDAAHCLLDLLQFGRDLHDDTDLITSMGGGVEMAVALKMFFRQRDADGHEHPPALAVEAFSAEALRVLQSGLAILDRDPPAVALGVRGDVVAFGEALRTGTLDTASPWTIGYRWTRLCVEALRELDGIAARVEDVSGPWSELGPRLTALSSEKSANPLVELLRPNVRGVVVSSRKTVATLRMARTLIAVIRGKSVDLADPFGGRIRVRKEGARTTFWSRGEDGTDDGGDPKRDVVLSR